ncbi:NB-ARC domain-containing protein [Kribbella sp. CA-253562]|uniref:NB-ARC domain-containing protein n=1 Tax=Kribbella sp. CA-253562 TaxID=3239942 RepID=UPI003D8F62CE
MTQERLAELAEVSVQAVNALEGGRRLFPRPSTVTQLAEAMGLADDERELLEVAARRPKGREVGGGVPRQLPPAIGDFVGRDGQLGELVGLLRSPLAAAPGIVISAIGGMAGIGKTTLAVQAAHQVLEEFPDGQLYLNLRGGGDEPLATAEALDALLQTLGLPPAGTADDVPTTAARYRTALAGRRILLLLDDVASVEQVAPLMPGTAGAVVVLTSRQPLSTLPGARHLALEVLSEHEAVALLSEVVGAAAVEADRDIALEIVRRCGFLPLAIRIAGGRARTSGLGELAARLAKAEGRQEVLTGPAAEVARSISLSLDHLASSSSPVDVSAGSAFPVLALLDGDRFPLRAAAKVLEVSLDDAEDLLERLVDVHLLEAPAIHQYRMHDLVRETGRTLAAAMLPSSMIADVRSRELACYLSTIWRWHELVGRDEKYGSRTGVPWSAGAEDLEDVGRVESWLESELPNLLRLVRVAAAGDSDDRLVAVRLALGMPVLAVALMRFTEARAAVAIATEVPDDLPLDLEFGRLYWAGAMASALGLYEEAGHWLRRALPVARALNSSADIAACLIDLGYGLGCLGRPAEGMPLCAEALAMVVDSGLGKLEVGVNVTLGSLAGLAGDLELQRSAFERALALMPGRSAPVPRAIHTNMVGRSYRDSHQYDASAAILRANIEVIRDLGQDILLADAHEELGATFLAAGRFTEAEQILREGLILAARRPTENREAPMRTLLGQVLVELGSPDEASEQWRRAVVLYDRVADPRAVDVRKLLSEV